MKFEPVTYVSFSIAIRDKSAFCAVLCAYERIVDKLNSYQLSNIGAFVNCSSRDRMVCPRPPSSMFHLAKWKVVSKKKICRRIGLRIARGWKILFEIWFPEIFRLFIIRNSFLDRIKTISSKNVRWWAINIELNKRANLRFESSRCLLYSRVHYVTDIHSAIRKCFHAESPLLCISSSFNQYHVLSSR